MHLNFANFQLCDNEPIEGYGVPRQTIKNKGILPYKAPVEEVCLFFESVRNENWLEQFLIYSAGDLEFERILF